MKIGRFKKIYIYLHMKYCDFTHKKYLKKYIVVFKYKNKIGYFLDKASKHIHGKGYNPHK